MSGRETVREIVVVVASILIAFSLDAWWSGFVEGRQLRQQLAVVIVELEAGRAELLEGVSSHRVIGGAAAALYGHLRGRDPDEVVATADTLVGALFSYFTMDITTTATTAFIDKGGLEVIEDRAARDALSNWPAKMRDAIDDQAQLRAVVQDGYVPYMVSTFSLDGAIPAGSDMIRRAIREERGMDVPAFRSSPATVSLRAAPELLNHLSWRVNNEATRQAQMERLLAEQDSLIRILRAVLDR